VQSIKKVWKFNLKSAVGHYGAGALAANIAAPRIGSSMALMARSLPLALRTAIASGSLRME
jgi:hypothetical protein